MRTKLPNRRDNTTLQIDWVQASGATRHVLVTVGIDPDGKIKEVFTADFKAGSDHLAIITDTCILISQLLQRGIGIEEMAQSMCEPPSLIGAICQAIVGEQLRLDQLGLVGDADIWRFNISLRCWISDAGAVRYNFDDGSVLHLPAPANAIMTDAEIRTGKCL